MAHETERRTLALLARQFSVSQEPGPHPPAAFIAHDGRRIAVAIATVLPTRPDATGGTIARLRDDRVARRVLADLDAAMGAPTPEGRTAIVTLGAPIKRPNLMLKTLTALLVDRIARGPVGVEEMADILGNRVRWTILGEELPWTAEVTGFVFTADPGPEALVRTIRALHAVIVAEAATCTPDRFAGGWWLVLSGEAGVADIQTYRRAFSRLTLPARFERILLTDGTRIEPLVG